MLISSFFSDYWSCLQQLEFEIQFKTKSQIAFVPGIILSRENKKGTEHNEEKLIHISLCGEHKDVKEDGLSNRKEI